MLALIYIFAAWLFGDLLCRRFLRFDSLMHRFAAAFLAGALISSCLTYLLAVSFSFTNSPLLWANIAFFGIITGVIYLLVKFTIPLTAFLSGIDTSPRPAGNWRLDLLCLAICMLFGWLLMSSMLTYKDGNVLFTIGSWSDFGANISLTQSLAWGNNYPTVHPFFPGEIIHYHFLYWFLAANLVYLGLNVVTAINFLSLLSLGALLMLMMTFAEKLFNSRVVARISLIFFFLATSSLSYIPFLISQNSLSEIVAAIIARKVPLTSGFPYHGEGWGSLSVISFLAQRQLIAASGIVPVSYTHLTLPTT